MKQRERRKIVTLQLDMISYSDALEKIVELGKNRTSSYVCFANVHMTMEAYRDSFFSEQVNNANLVLADGMPLVKTIGSFYKIKQDRIAGMDLMPDVLREADRNKLKVFFFGTSDELLAAIKQKVQQNYPGAEVVGTFAPPFGESLNNNSYLTKINDSGAQIVFVALGCPKQEKWMAENSAKLSCVLLGVGGAFATFAGTAKRAPSFMRNVGLEWLYRLAQEPQRLFNRYLKTNTAFMYLTFKAKIKSTLFSKSAFD
jgi:N-acetylglucosaminyldiphosphoundecaprenol N-acetyl-beta-D-mannosaminyltransferase